MLFCKPILIFPFLWKNPTSPQPPLQSRGFAEVFFCLPVEKPVDSVENSR